MPLFHNPILQAIPDPALIVKKGRVTCFNSAALAMFPTLAENAPVPAVLSHTVSGAGSVLAAGQSWHVCISPLDEGLLYLFRPARLEGMSRFQLDGTVRRLREQMSHLLLSVQLLRRDLPQDAPPRQLERFADMNRTLCQMLRLTEQLDLLRDLEAGSIPFLPVTLDVAGLCRETCTACTALLELFGVTLRFESPFSSLLVPGDSALLEKLLLELIANAARAAGRGGTLCLSLSRRDDRAVLLLSGDGSSDNSRPLSRLLLGDGPDDRIPQPGEGAGLGLILAQRICTLHNGALMMEQREGISVTVALPLSGPGVPLSVRARRADYAGGFSPALVELSDLLPQSAFLHLDEE